MIKSYVIDTNILIQAPYACQCFEENRVILPLVVLEELDGLKKAREEADRANEAKTNFLRRMSHDIRTPINGIRGLVQMSYYYGNDLEKLQDYVVPSTLL